MTWILFTLFAALMQSVRTAGQKQMTGNLSALTVSWSRYGFGFPVALAYLWWLSLQFNGDFNQQSLTFWIYIFIASVSQLIATVLLVKVLSMRNFAVATTYAKTEALLTALVALVFFQRALGWMGWLAIALGLAGILFVSIQKSHLQVGALLRSKSALYGLGAGLCFAFTSVLVREASLLSSSTPIYSAAFILTVSIFIQGAICTVLVHRENKHNWRLLKNHLGLGWFVGITGALGSIGWFTAFALQEAALVKTLGQIEFLFTILLTTVFFKERIHRYEWAGMLLVLLSILVLLMPTPNS
jgi:drug/metabolite transporter (DMT)-like permease